MQTRKDYLPHWTKAVLGLIIVALLAGGAWFYHVQKQTIIAAAEQELTSIARLKVNQIASWREDELESAGTFAAYPFLLEHAAALLASPTGKATRELRDLLQMIQQEDHYVDILLVDLAGRVHLSLSGNVKLTADYKSVLDRALAEEKPVFTPLHSEPDRPSPHISIVVPLLAADGGEHRPLGALVLISNASEFLFPLIQVWPTAGLSGETLLVQRDGDDALVMNELRHQEGTALKLRVPLNRTEVPAVMAVLGKQGAVRGVDCRGIPVLAVILPVPNCDWFMVAKVDIAEVLTAWRFRAVLILMLLMSVVTLTFVAGLVAWQRNQKVYFRELYLTEAALRESAEQYRTLAEDLPAMVCTFLPDSTLTYVNRTHADYFCVTPEELVGRKFLDFLPGDSVQSVQETFLSLTPDKPTHTYCHPVMRNGQEFWMEWTDQAFFDENGMAVKFQSVGFDITERKKAEDALKESEDRYRDLVESSHDLICTHDLEGRILSVNLRPAKVLGYSREDLQRLTIRDVLVPEMRHKFDEYLNAIKTHGEARGDMHVLTSSGERRIWEYHNSLRKDGITGPIVRGMAHDVTERRRAEAALQRSEALFKKLFEKHSAVKLIIDPNSGTFVDANEAAANFYGWSRDQLRQMKVEDVNPMPPEEIRQAIEKVRSGQQTCFDFRHRRADGSIRDVEIFSSKIEVEGKDLLHSIVHDVTERKTAEEERERLMAAIEQAGEVVVITDADGTIQYVNPAFERVTGYGREEVLGRNPRILKSGAQDEAFYRELWQTIGSGRTWHGRMANKRKDGSLFTEDVTISPVCDAAGRIHNYVAVKHDITEHLRLTAQYQQAQKMESIGRLAGGVAHDYNNMLGVIIGYADLAMREVEPNTRLHDALQQILKAARRSSDLTRQLLAFARKQTIAPRPLDLNETIESMLKMLRRLIGEDIELAWLPASDLGMVKMDPAQIDQVLANLCVNARDAISGVGKVIIETGHVTLDDDDCAEHVDFKPGEYVFFAVSDNGCGIGEETLEHIFEPFFTTKEMGKGTGLGLATVYGIVRQNHGFINVFSEPGHGSTFKIYLPRYVGEARKVDPESAGEILPGRGETVLLVEDEATMLKAVQTMLERLGYRVLAARAPDEALRLSREHAGTIHLLVTDVVMPEMNGRDLARLVEMGRPNLHVLFMSGYAAGSDVLQSELNEGAHFIQKPFSIQELAAKVRLAMKEGEKS
jgi:PAS domain S-box-containing protein